VIPTAYREASQDKDGNPLPTKARQVMYAARPEILRLTGLSGFDDNTFTQKLLPKYQREHPEECAEWEVVYDARGHLLEPHTGYEIGVGTSEVKAYLKEAQENLATDGRIALPEFSFRYPTRGPRHRYRAILFVEKEGFNELFDRVRLGDRFDLAIMSSKGMGSTATRQLLEAFSPGVKILVMRDFDKSGFSIVGTLRRNTERFQSKQPPEIIDMGLRLNDVRRYNLPSEPEEHPSDPGPNLEKNGATGEEINFLRGEGYWTRQKNGRPKLAFHGQRVELNTLTNRRLLEWLEAKLITHQVQKVIPDDTTLEVAYRRTLALKELDRRLRDALPEAEQTAQNAGVPQALHTQIARKLVQTPHAAWDDVLSEIATPEKSMHRKG
jgi:hypothetical protein